MTLPINNTLAMLQDMVRSAKIVADSFHTNGGNTGSIQLLGRIAKEFDKLNKHMSEKGCLPDKWDRVARMRPQYTHDCNKCRFLGTWEDQDLYFCAGELNGTVIARYGNGGHEYASTPTEYTKSLSQEKLQSTSSPALRVGVLIAEDLGLLKQPIRETHVKGYRVIDTNTMKVSEIISNERDAFRASCTNCKYESNDYLNSCPKEIVKIITCGTDK